MTSSSRTADTNPPSIAGIYDYQLGGTRNSASERDVVDRLERAIPIARVGARANRAFVRRAVAYLAERGIDQFLDIGSGILTSGGNVHEVARAAHPDASVVYVDIDSAAVAYGRELLADDPRATAIHADIRDTEHLLGHPDLIATLDLGRPFAVLIVAVLHWLDDADDPAGIVARFRAAMPSGSYLTISHICDDAPPTTHSGFDDFLSVHTDTGNPTIPRPAGWIDGLFTGMSLVEPGLTQLEEWRPDSAPDPWESHYSWLAGVALKR